MGKMARLRRVTRRREDLPAAVENLRGSTTTSGTRMNECTLTDGQTDRRAIEEKEGNLKPI